MFLKGEETKMLDKIKTFLGWFVIIFSVFIFILFAGVFLLYFAIEIILKILGFILELIEMYST